MSERSKKRREARRRAHTKTRPSATRVFKVESPLAGLSREEPAELLRTAGRAYEGEFEKSLAKTAWTMTVTGHGDERTHDGYTLGHPDAERVVRESIGAAITAESDRAHRRSTEQRDGRREGEKPRSR